MSTNWNRIPRVRRRPITPWPCVLRGGFVLALALWITGFTDAQETAPTAQCPPAARLDSAKDTYGNTVVADPYRWLEDQNSPETRAWIAAEQECTDAVLSKLPGRAQLNKRLGELLHTDSFEAPVERGGRYFFPEAAGRAGPLRPLCPARFERIG
ncbi:MAG TPA: hypothetical protein VIW93_05280 [Candidatus Acidoferrum sp.]